MKTIVCTYTVKSNPDYNWGGKGPFTLTEIIKKARELDATLWDSVEDLIPSKTGWNPFAPRDYRDIINYINWDRVRWDRLVKLKRCDREIRLDVLDFANKVIDKQFLYALISAMRNPLAYVYDMNKAFVNSPTRPCMLCVDNPSNTESDAIILETELMYCVKTALEEYMAQFSKNLYDDYCSNSCDLASWDDVRPHDDDTDTDDE